MELAWLSLFAFLLLPSHLVTNPSTRLDASWGISLELASNAHFVFGSEYIFTYGPLAFLCTKMAIAYSHYWIVLFELFMVSLSIFVLDKGLRNLQYAPIVCFSIALGLFLIQPVELTFLLTPLFIVLLLLFFDTKKLGYAYLAALLSILCLYVKVNYGIVLFFLFYTSFAFGYLSKVISSKELGKLFLFHLVLTLVTSYMLKVSLVDYFKASTHLISGYNEAMFMSMSIFDWKLILAIEIIGVFIIGACLYFTSIFKDRLFFIGFFLSSVYMYLLFKNGYVRAQDHFYGFYRLAFLPFGIVYLFVLKGKGKWIGMLSILVLVLCLNVLIVLEVSNAVLIPLKNLPKKLAYFKDYFPDATTQTSWLKDKSASPALNDAFLSQIGAHAIDVIPTEISLIHKHQLNYQPRPIIQSYSAYNEYLDSLNYKKYISPKAPEYVLFQNSAIDNRVPFWDESITKRALLSQYHLIAADTLFKNEFWESDTSSKAKLLLLQKNIEPLKFSKANETSIKLVLGEPYIIPKSDNVLCYLYANVTYTLWGKIQGFLYQPPQLEIELMYQDGTKCRFKAIVPILKTGVLINKKIHTTDDAAIFFRTKGVQNVGVISVKFYTENKGLNSFIQAKIVEYKVR